MASYDGISQVHVGYGALGTRNRAVRKWSEEQTDLFAKVLSTKRIKDGFESCWSEELENLAVKKSSNEKLFKEIQTSLEIELLKVDQSVRDSGDEATFSIPQLRAKYKWLKREWKIIQNKIKHGLLREDIKSPSWYKRLHPIFSVYLDFEREERDHLRPSMVSENGSIHNGQSNVDELSDSCSATPERSWIVNIDTRPSPALDTIEIIDVKTKGGEDDDGALEEDFENNMRGQEMQINAHAVAGPERAASKRTLTITNDRASPQAKIRKTETYESSVNNRAAIPQCPPGFCQPNTRTHCSCSSSNGDRYVEIIKYLLDAEERRERLFMDFQREQAESNRHHELKMAQIFVDLSSQQKILTSEMSNIKEMLSVKRKTGGDFE